MRFENGSSLSLAGDVCRIEKLQGLPAVPPLHDVLLLALLRCDVDLALGGSLERQSVHREFHANQLRLAVCDFWDHRLGLDRLHRVALKLGVQGSDDYRVLGEDAVPQSPTEDYAGKQP